MTAIDPPEDVITIYVEIDGKEVLLNNVANPVSYEDLAARLVALGHKAPTTLMSTSRPYAHIEVTNKPSSFTPGRGGSINLDQPLVHFYHYQFLPANEDGQSFSQDTEKLGLSESLMTDYGSTVEVGGVGFTFMRTLRVPDSSNTSALPPGMGTFNITSVADALKNHPLPQVVRDHGGVFIAMYAREAMWLSFRPRSDGLPCAVRICVGGVNAITGEVQMDAMSRAPNADAKQDYVVVGGLNSQPWLDGIATSPGVVRQFVAMPLGEGYTVEGQVTGREDNGGVQIDVYPMYNTTAAFRLQSALEGDATGKPLDSYKTPRELGLTPGRVLRMCDLNSPLERICLSRAESTRGAVRMDSPKVKLVASDDGFIVFVDVRQASSWGQVEENRPEPIQFSFGSGKTTVVQLKEEIKRRTGAEPSRLTLKRGDAVIPGDGAWLEGCGIRSGELLSAHVLLDDMSHAFGRGRVGTGTKLRGARGTASTAGGANVLSGIAPGGKIKQRVNADTRPACAYDIRLGSSGRLHVHILNAALSEALTGVKPGPSPISAQTYMQHGLPWFDIYDEPQSAAGVGQGPLSAVKSLAQIEQDRHSGGQAACGQCDLEMATLRVQPCGHLLCDSCSVPGPRQTCRCGVAVERVKRLAAPMRLPGTEGEDVVRPGDADERVHMLALCRLKGVIASFFVGVQGGIRSGRV